MGEKTEAARPLLSPGDQWLKDLISTVWFIPLTFSENQRELIKQALIADIHELMLDIRRVDVFTRLDVLPRLLAEVREEVEKT